MKPTLRQALATYQPPPPNPAAPAQTVALLRSLPPRRTTSWQFLWAQAGFIHKRMWALQLAFAALLAALAATLPQSGLPTPRVLALFSAAAPLLILINISDLMRIYNGGMLEIELATRYSLPKVAAARLLLFGVSDAALLLAAAALGAAATDTGVWALLLYCLTPFNAMCLVCLMLLRRIKADHLPMAAAAAAVLLAGALAALDARAYAPSAQHLWLLAFAATAATAAATAWQLRGFLRGLRRL